MPILLDAACQTFYGTKRTYTFLLVTSPSRGDWAHLVVFADDTDDPDKPLYVVKNAVRVDTSPDVHPRTDPRRLRFAEGGAMTIVSQRKTHEGKMLRADVIVEASGDMLVVVEHGITCDLCGKSLATKAFFNAHYALSFDDAYYFRSHYQSDAPNNYAEDMGDQTGRLEDFRFVTLQEWRHDSPLPPEIAGPMEKWRALWS